MGVAYIITGKGNPLIQSAAWGGREELYMPDGYGQSTRVGDYKQIVLASTFP
jgi:hypothetical protein